MALAATAKIKAQDVTKGMRIRVVDEDGCWMEGVAETEAHISGYSRNKTFVLCVDTKKIYSDDSAPVAIAPKNTKIGIHTKCFLVD